MQRRNFVILILVLLGLLAGFLAYLFWRMSPQEREEPGTNFLARFNPFDSSGPSLPPTEIPPAEIPPGEIPPGEIPVRLQLQKISSVPVAGYGFFLKERYVDESDAPTAITPSAPQTEWATAVRYVERENGNISETFVDKIEEKKFSITLIPKIYEAFFGSKSEWVLMRYLQDDGRTIETFFAKLPAEVLGEDTAVEISGYFLPAGISDLALSPDQMKVFYLTQQGEITTGTTFEFATLKKTAVFESPFNEWLPYWSTDSTVFLSSKASFVAPGYLYRLDLISKNLSQVLGGTNGLTANPNPNGKTVLYGDTNLTLSVYHSDTKVASSLGVRTLPEKCVWNKTGNTLYCAAPKTINGINYPDTWYQGSTSFEDAFWKIDVETGNAEIILDPATVSGELIDAWKLSVDSTEKYLLFVNKRDSFLWRLEL